MVSPIFPIRVRMSLEFFNDSDLYLGMGESQVEAGIFLVVVENPSCYLRTDTKAELPTLSFVLEHG